MPNRVDVGTLASAYAKAKIEVISAGYGEEIVWQKSVKTEETSEEDFLRECAWVILCSGMREAVVHRKFSSICTAFLDWSSAREIVLREKECVDAALKFFGHKGKMNAIAGCARIVHTKGFHTLQQEMKSDALLTLKQFPYIGPVTSYHLAKNIGFAVAKPDRHLCRLAEVCGYPDALNLCEELSKYIGDPVAVVDVVLWRFATMTPNYSESFLSRSQWNA